MKNNPKSKAALDTRRKGISSTCICESVAHTILTLGLFLRVLFYYTSCVRACLSTVVPVKCNTRHCVTRMYEKSKERVVDFLYKPTS